MWPGGSVGYKREPTVTSSESPVPVTVTGVTIPQSESFDTKVAIANTSHSIEKCPEDNLI